MMNVGLFFLSYRGWFMYRGNLRFFFKKVIVFGIVCLERYVKIMYGLKDFLRSLFIILRFIVV